MHKTYDKVSVTKIVFFLSLFICISSGPSPIIALPCLVTESVCALVEFCSSRQSSALSISHRTTHWLEKDIENMCESRVNNLWTSWPCHVTRFAFKLKMTTLAKTRNIYHRYNHDQSRHFFLKFVTTKLSRRAITVHIVHTIWGGTSWWLIDSESPTSGCPTK